MHGSVLESQGLVGRKILVVDDSRTQRAQVTALARGLGAGLVREAADGLEALAILDEPTEIDLVLCDLEMPRMDGVVLIGEIAARGLTPHLLIMSSLDSGIRESVKHMAWSYGLACAEVLPKPVSRESLLGILAAPPFHSPFTPSRVRVLAAEDLSLKDIQNGMKNREFECFYQPQVAMVDGSLKGVEALLRWRHPDLGILRPAQFLKQVEEDPETMSVLTLQILSQVAEAMGEWTRDGVEPDVSVNLSLSSLSTPGFADRILAAAAAHAIEPHRIILEVTESASISNLGHTLSNLARLRMRGFRLSIDDFGTGYATYEQLERIPFTELKIDISITRELPKSRKHSILAKSLLRLAKDLRLHTVAEGIETRESWDALKGLGCNCGQGYFLARPMPGSQVPRWAAAPVNGN